MIESATSGMSLEAMQAAPVGKWNVAQVLEHLLLTYTGTVKGFDRLLESGAPKPSPATLPQRFATLLVAGVGYFPRGRQAPSGVVPKGMSADKVLPALRLAIAIMDVRITDAERRFGRGKICDHPVLGPLTARQWRRFHYVHARHHMKQIRALRAQG